MLDGLLTDFSGQPTAVRHTANPLILPSPDRLFEARDEQAWLSEMQSEGRCQLPFRDLYVSMFDPTSSFGELRLPYLALRVILEALQSLIYENYEAGGTAIGSPSTEAIGVALLRLYHHHISTLASVQERVEHSIRWHVICIRLAVETSSLAQRLCATYGIPQALHGSEHLQANAIDLSEWGNTINGRRALLHATAIAELSQELTLGRAHAAHLPMAIYASAAVHTAMLVAANRSNRKPIIGVPHIHSWEEVWASNPSEGAHDHDPADQNEVQAFLAAVQLVPGRQWSRRNLADDLNGLHLVMEQLRPYWGVSSTMSLIIRQWLQRSVPGSSSTAK